MHLDTLLAGTLLKSVKDTGQGDGLTLAFDNGRLKIDNPFSLKCASNETVTLDAIVGCHVTSASFTPDEIMIVFEGMIYLCISLREEDFIGPQAASFASDSGEVIVFN